MTSSRTSTADQSSAINPWSSAGPWCIAGAVIATVGAIATATIHSSVPPADLSYPYTPTAFRLTEVLWTVTHVLMFIGTVGLTRSGLLGTSRLGQLGKRIALGSPSTDSTRHAAPLRPLEISDSHAPAFVALVFGLLGLVERPMGWTAPLGRLGSGSGGAAAASGAGASATRPAGYACWMHRPGDGMPVVATARSSSRPGR